MTFNLHFPIKYKIKYKIHISYLIIYFQIYTGHFFIIWFILTSNSPSSSIVIVDFDIFNIN